MTANKFDDPKQLSPQKCFLNKDKFYFLITLIIVQNIPLITISRDIHDHFE